MFLRDFVFEASMLMLGGYALWRMERSPRLGLKVHDPEVSMSRYFGAVRHHLADAVRSRAIQLQPPTAAANPKVAAPPAPVPSLT